jgi:hypothetical protein
MPTLIVINVFLLQVLRHALPMVRWGSDSEWLRVFPRTRACDAVGGRCNTSELLRIRDTDDVVEVELGRWAGDKCERHAERVDADERLGLVLVALPPFSRCPSGWITQLRGLRVVHNE